MAADWIERIGPNLLFGILLLLTLATYLGLKRMGMVRIVRVAVVALLAYSFIGHIALHGLASGLFWIGGVAASVFASMSWAVSRWRQPVSMVLSPATLADCPKDASGRLQRWTVELEEQNFEMQSEQRMVSQYAGADRETFIRFFTHHSEPLWVEIYIATDPKTVGRIAMSDKGGGRAVITSDQLSDYGLFDDPWTTTQHVPGGFDCAALIDAHRKIAMTTEGSPRRVDDPEVAHVELHGGWVQRVLASGQVRLIDGCKIGMRPMSIPRIVLKIFVSWFH